MANQPLWPRIGHENYWI